MRLIDADKLIDDYNRSNGTISDLMELILDAAEEATPPNDPLTLSELREMDGEPVWNVVDNLQKGGYYCLCDKGVILCQSGKRFDCKDIPNWVFLRRKLEEMEELK